jgi:hypothetical protein
MRDQYIFDIPIYRNSKDDFYTEIDSSFEKRVEWIISHDPERRPLDHEVRQRVHHSVIAEFGGPWQFNQIVGWLRLFVEGNTIGCHPWWVDAKRINRRMRNKRLYLQTPSDILQARFRNESPNEIYSILLERLVRLSKDNSYNNLYIDLDVFRRIGPFIDWHRLLFVRPNQK